MNCTVRDLPERGARLVFAMLEGFPDEVELEIPLKDVRHYVRLVWRQGGTRGVVFRNEPQSQKRTR
jgi:hypothetical protein